MNNKPFFLFLLLTVFCGGLFAQKMTFSEVFKEDDRNTNFEIIGKVGANYHIFKQVRYKFNLQVLNDNMETQSNERLDFLPENTYHKNFLEFKQMW